MISGKKVLAVKLLVYFATLSFPSFAQIAPINGMGMPLCKNLYAVDFKVDAPVGQWLLGYYSGALSMNMSFSLSQGKSSDVPKRAEKWDDESLLETARVNCANHPEKHLYQVANMVVTMVLD